MNRCVGAFRRPCLRLTERIICDQCHEEVAAVPPQGRRWRAGLRMLSTRHGEPHHPQGTPGSVRLPFRGDVW